jgi:hypothetical protein
MIFGRKKTIYQLINFCIVPIYYLNRKEIKYLRMSG